MAYEFKLPDLGEGRPGGEAARWLVAEGDEIAEDQPLVEIQTDKTTVEIPSSAAGVLTKNLFAHGGAVAGGPVLVVIGGAAVAAAPLAVERAAPAPTAAPAPSPAGRIQATPLVRRIAA